MARFASSRRPRAISLCKSLEIYAVIERDARDLDRVPPAVVYRVGCGDRGIARVRVRVPLAIVGWDEVGIGQGMDARIRGGQIGFRRFDPRGSA